MAKQRPWAHNATGMVRADVQRGVMQAYSAKLCREVGLGITAHPRDGRHKQRLDADARVVHLRHALRGRQQTLALLPRDNAGPRPETACPAPIDCLPHHVKSASLKQPARQVWQGTRQRHLQRDASSASQIGGQNLNEAVDGEHSLGNVCDTLHLQRPPKIVSIGTQPDAQPFWQRDVPSASRSRGR